MSSDEDLSTSPISGNEDTNDSTYNDESGEENLPVIVNSEGVEIEPANRRQPTPLSNSSSTSVADTKDEEDTSKEKCEIVEVDTAKVGGSDGKLPQNGSSTLKSRPTMQPTKRRPDKELNHDNWDQEDEPEEKGEFVKASEEQLKDRKILTAKRKQKPAGQTSNNPFGAISLAGGFGGFGGNEKSSVASMFNFGSVQPPSAVVPKFDFSNTSYPNKGDDKKGENTVSETSSKKLRREEEAESAPEPEGSNSATTV